MEGGGPERPGRNTKPPASPWLRGSVLLVLSSGADARKGNRNRPWGSTFFAIAAGSPPLTQPLYLPSDRASPFPRPFESL